jgi:hypothetical protein
MIGWTDDYSNALIAKTAKTNGWPDLSATVCLRLQPRLEQSEAEEMHWVSRDPNSIPPEWKGDWRVDAEQTSLAIVC